MCSQRGKREREVGGTSLQWKSFADPAFGRGEERGERGVVWEGYLDRIGHLGGMGGRDARTCRQAHGAEVIVFSGPRSIVQE